MSFKNLSFTLPRNWKEASRTGTDRQLNIQLYHVNPLAKVNPKIFQDELISSNEKSSVAKLGVSTPSGQGYTGEFFESMKAFIASGFAPKDLTYAKIEDLHKKMTQTPGAERPDESDLATNIIITKYDSTEMAKEALENYGTNLFAGFGLPKTKEGKSMSYVDLINSDILKPHLTVDQSEKLKELRAKLKEKAPEIEKATKEVGLNYKHEIYLGYPAVYAELPNNTPKPTKSIPNAKSKNKFVGGGSRGNATYVPLPKITQPYQEKIKMYQAILVKNYVVTGGLIGAALLLPPANKPCYSLTKTENKYETVEGIKSTYMVASASNYMNEGYLTRESTEEVLKEVLSKL